MNYLIPQDLQGFVASKIQAGLFSSQEEVLNTALSRMRREEEEKERQLAWLVAEIQEGIESCKLGNMVSAGEIDSEIAMLKEKLR